MRRTTAISLALILLPTLTVRAFDIPEISGYDLFSSTAENVVNGTFSLAPKDILGTIGNMLAGEIRTFAKESATVLVMAVLSSAAGALNSAVGENESGKVSFFVFYTLISGLALSCFDTALGFGTDVVYKMTEFMDKFTPILITALFTCCKSASAAAFEPILSAAIFVISVVIEKCLVPLMTFSAVLAVAGNVGDKVRISGFIKTLKSVTRWLMAFVITLFTGINAIYGFSASSLDAAGAKTIKFAVGSLVPVVGGFLSDTLDTVVSSASLLKNAAGVSGIIVMCCICAAPVFKLGIMQLMLKICAAVAEPITDSRISGMLWDVSEAVTSVFGTVILTAVLFIVNICIIIGATS